LKVFGVDLRLALAVYFSNERRFIMQVKSPVASSEKWLRKSTMAYLEGDRDLKWIAGIIGRDISRAGEVLIGLQNYGDPKRHQELSDWCNRERPPG
jgi:hypothetical protein